MNHVSPSKYEGHVIPHVIYWKPLLVVLVYSVLLICMIVVLWVGLVKRSHLYFNEYEEGTVLLGVQVLRKLPRETLYLHNVMDFY